MQFCIDQYTKKCHDVHMRTTITIPKEILEQAMEISQSKHYSEAIVSSLKDYLALKERLELLEDLFSKKVPHTFQKIKKKRQKRKWSS